MPRYLGLKYEKNERWMRTIDYNSFENELNIEYYN